MFRLTLGVLDGGERVVFGKRGFGCLTKGEGGELVSFIPTAGSGGDFEIAVFTIFGEGGRVLVTV